MNIRFQDPLWLLLLAALGAIGILAIRRQRRVAVLYSDVSLLRTLPATLALRIKRALPWVRLAGLGLVIAALARPQHGIEEFRIHTEGIAIEMCIDRSGSMAALDFNVDGQQVDRLAIVKQVFQDFVMGKGKLPGRPDDLIGLITFGGFVEPRCPLTLDHGALVEVLKEVEIPHPIFDNRGEEINRRLWQEDSQTAIGDALALAANRLKDAHAKSKVIILLTDGEQTAGVLQPAEGAKIAKTLGVKVYTIGIGSNGVVPIPDPYPDAFGRRVLRQEVFPLDEQTLKQIADVTGGKYFSAQDTESLEDVYAEIDRQEKSASEGRLYSEYHEWYQYLMFPGLGLILAEILLAGTRFRSLP
ncbi:MAG: VWA domain-containing protein [Thermoguttaceae bacterium]